MVRAIGLISLFVLFAGLVFAQQADDFIKLDKDGVTYFRVAPSGAAEHTATDNANPALKVTQSGTSAAAVFSGGKVGIGTTNPLELFHVSGGHFLMDNQKAIKYKDSVGTAYPAFQLYNDEMYIDNQAAGGINFRTNPSKGSASIRMFIKNDGSVGIGTTSPTSDLEVIGIADSSAVLTVGAGSGASTDKVFRVLGDTNPVTERFTVLRGGNVGIGTTSPSNKLHVQGSDSAGRMAVIENTASSGSPEGLLVLTSQNSGTGPKFAVGTGTVGSHTKNFVVTNDGNAAVGTTNPQGYKLYVNGSFWASSGPWSSSDERLKRDIVSIDGAIEKVSKLNGVSFSWDKEACGELNVDEGRQIGVIAQDVEKILPELIRTDENGYKAVNYGAMAPILINAVKELKAENDTLKNQLTVAEARLKALEDKLK